jgi:hypothetical protein
MAKRELSKAEHELVVRCIMDVQHILIVRNRGTFVEAGTPPQDADDVNSCVMEDDDLIAALGLALATLGHGREDPTPPPTLQQLESALRMSLRKMPR